MNSNTPLIEWHEESLSVGNTRMDETHREFINIINQLGQALDEHFSGLFEQLIEHTREHFQNEDIAMENSAFPAIFVHRNEHFRVLDELKQLAHHVDKGELDAAKAFVSQYLPEWFLIHAATMDRALAHHLRISGMVAD